MLIFQTIFHTIVLRLFCYSVLIVKAIQVENLGRNGKKQEIVQTQHHTNNLNAYFPFVFPSLGFSAIQSFFLPLCFKTVFFCVVNSTCTTTTTRLTSSQARNVRKLLPFDSFRFSNRWSISVPFCCHHVHSRAL